MSDELIQWHTERAKELNAHADQLIGAAHDVRSSEYTRGEKKQRAEMARGMADMHLRTVQALSPCLTCDGKPPFCGTPACRSAYDAVPHRSSAEQLGRMEDADRNYNLAVLGNDPLLRGILTRYRCLTLEQKQKLADIVAEFKVDDGLPPSEVQHHPV